MIESQCHIYVMLASKTEAIRDAIKSLKGQKKAETMADDSDWYIVIFNIHCAELQYIALIASFNGFSILDICFRPKISTNKFLYTWGWHEDKNPASRREKKSGTRKMHKSNVRIKIGPPRRQRPDEDKNWRIFGKNVRIKIADFGHFQIRHLSVLSGVLLWRVSIR